MLKFKIYKSKIITLFSIFLYLTLILGFFFDEDSLGGAEHDYNYHLKIIFSFKENILSTLENFGTDKMATRNSPFFFILYGTALRFFDSLDILRIFNLQITLIIIFFFNKCLKIKFNYIKSKIIFLLSMILFLSPTFRSLAIWPYPFIYAILFFIISIFFFLKFEKKNKFKYVVFHIFFIALSSYMTPNFSVFSIFFFFKFFNYYKFDKKFFIIIFFYFLISFPALFFLIKKDFYLFTNDVSVIKFYDKINISNKIVLISCIVFFHLLPIVLTLYKKIILNKNDTIIILILYFISIIFFDFQKKYNEGGGVIYKFSYFLLDNNLLVFTFYLFALIYLYKIVKNFFFNFLLIILLIPYNLQFSIFHKYYDPLIIIIFFLLLNNNLSKKYFNYKNVFYLYAFQIFFLILSLNKNFLYNFKLQW
jgi:hypothetical protein